MAEEFEPKIIGFLCNWCSYAGADIAGTSKLDIPPSLVPVKVMCSSRVNPVLVANALLQGADGVMIAGCHPGDCHYEKGNYFARRRFAYTKKVVGSLGLEAERLELFWVSAAEGARFAEVVNKFTTRIKGMGANPIKEKNTQ